MSSPALSSFLLRKIFDLVACSSRCVNTYGGMKKNISSYKYGKRYSHQVLIDENIELEKVYSIHC